MLPKLINKSCTSHFRKQKSDLSDEKFPPSLQAYVDGLFFNKDENNLQDMIDSIPSGRIHGVQLRMISVDNIFGIFEIIIFFAFLLVFVTCGGYIWLSLSVNSIWKLGFAVSQASLIFQKRFPDVVSK